MLNRLKDVFESFQEHDVIGGAVSSQRSITHAIAARLNSPPRPLKVILFGSHAKGRAGDDSDVDLVIVLDKPGKSESYRAMIENRMEISRRLGELREKYPIDLLVYTKDEWEELKTSGSSFVEAIEREGVAIL